MRVHICILARTCIRSHTQTCASALLHIHTHTIYTCTCRRAHARARRERERERDEVEGAEHELEHKAGQIRGEGPDEMITLTPSADGSAVNSESTQACALIIVVILSGSVA